MTTERDSENTALLARLLHASLDAIILTDYSGQVIDWNDVAEKTFGYSRREALGQNIAELTTRHLLQDLPPPKMASFLPGGDPLILNQRGEFIATRRDETTFPVELTVGLLQEDPPHFAVFIRDITDRNQQEEALRRSEERFRSLVDATSQIVWVRTPSGDFETEQREWSTFTGMPFDKIRGRGWLETIHPDDRERVSRAWDAALRTHSIYDTVYRMRRHDGTYCQMSVRGVPVLEVDGTTVREWVGISTDVTDQKEAEVRLQARLRQQEAVAHIGVSALSGTDLTDLMAEATRAVAVALGVELCKVLQLLPEERMLLPVAGFGWEGLFGHDKIPIGTASQGGFTLLTGDCVIVDDLRTERRFSGQPLLHDHGVVSGLSCIIPGPAGSGPWGVVLAHTKQHRVFGHDDTHFLQSVANVLATSVERLVAAETLARSEAQQRGMLRDVLASVTDGRLRLCESAADLPERFPLLGEPIQLDVDSLRSVRGRATEGAAAAELNRDRLNDLVTAVGEATMNAVTHAGGGVATVGVDRDQHRVQIWVEDTGTGIEMSLLPQATLRPGYTTTGTLGHGLKLILQTADCLWLLTGPTGTTAVLEVGQVAPPLGWLAALS
jgi:PAS domain S-box-containing protein